MRNIMCLSFFICFLQLSLFPHNEFFRRISPGSCELTEGVWNSNSGEFLTWQGYYNIPIAADLTIDFPFELDGNLAEGQFEDAVENWNSYSGLQLFNLQSSFGHNVRVQFINNTVIFPMPATQYRYGVTYHKFEEIDGRDRILVYSSYCPDYGTHTSIFLNSTNGRSFYWSQNGFITNPPPVLGHMDFEFVVSHELGHVLGLAHCSFEYPETMMHGEPPYNTFVEPYPRQKELDGLYILMSPVGIEDYIWVWDTYPAGGPFAINEISLGRIQSTFIDNFPYGDYIVEWYNWKVKALSSCGEVLVFEIPNNNLIDSENYFTFGSIIKWESFVKRFNESVTKIKGGN